MIKFKYLAKENTGNTVEGTIEAETPDDAVEKISQLGYLPVKVQEAVAAEEKHETPPPQAAPKPEPKVPQVTISSSVKVKSKEITAFGRQLSSLIRSGVPILRGIGIIAEPVENPQFKTLLTKIHGEIQEGKSFSSALSQYPRVFPPLYVALVSAGEASGTLDQTLARITDYRQKQEGIRSQLRSAMVYPILMALVGTGTIIFMLTFVMPRLLGVFSQLGGQLPTPTRILIAVSSSLRNGWFWGAAIVVTVFLIALFSNRSKAQRLALSELALHLPVAGMLTLKSEIARFSRTLELMIKSGIPILKAIETTAPVMGNEILKNELLRCLQDLKEGGSFGKSLRKSKRFPVFMTNLIIVGEESGKLDEALAEIATFYERETDEALRMMTSLLEPLMILVMGLVVGFIVIAMLLPMFELNMMVK